MATPATKSGVTPGTRAAKLVTGGVRVKAAKESLSTKRFEVKRPDGNPLMLGTKSVERPSQYDNALAGVWFKACLRQQGVPAHLSEWEKGLLHDSFTSEKWVGSDPVGDRYYGGGPDGYMPGMRVKALLDDSISGGLFLSPVQFDEAVITYPLLNGQIFPFVDLKQVSGRRVLAPTIRNLTMQWGIQSGQSATPFDTASLADNISTPVVPVQGFIEVSADLMLDSPVNIGETITGLYSERLKSELDRVICVGNGFNEPVGIISSPGMTAITSDNGVNGPPTVSDLEALIFGVPLAYRMQELNPGFIGNDTSYRRFRSIPVGPGDERRVFGQGMMGTDDTQRYQLFEYKFRVSNDLPNTKTLFGCLKRYRMYQAAGSQVIVERGGRALTLSNSVLIGVRQRFGGQPIDGAAFAVLANGQV